MSCQPSNDSLTFGNRFSAQIEGLTSLWSTSGSCLNKPSFFETGSNARLVEEDLIYNWEEYVKEMGKIRFSFCNEKKAPYLHLKSLDRTGYWKLLFILQDIILANSKTSMSG